MKNCPLCGWDLEPAWSDRFHCWSIVCIDWAIYAINEDVAIRKWEENYGEWMNNDKEDTNDDIIRFNRNL